MKLSNKNCNVSTGLPVKAKKLSLKVRLPSISVSVIAAIAGAGIGLALAFALGLWIQKTQINDERNRQLAELAQQKATLAAQSITSYFGSLNSNLEFYAQNTLLRRAVEGSEVDFLESQKQQILKQIEGAVAVSIVPFGGAELNEKSVPPIRYAQLEQILSVEQGKRQFPEGVKLDKKWQLYVMHAIPKSEGEGLLGTLWLTVSIKPLQSVLRQNDSALGRYRLSQNFAGGTSILVRSHGQGSLEARGKAKVGHTHWLVDFQAGRGLIAQTHINTGMAILIMVATGLFCIVAFAGLGFYLGYSIESKRRRLALNQRMLRPAAAGDDGDGLTDPLFQSKDIFDVKIKKADEKLLGIDDEEEGGEGENDVASDLSLDDDVFELVDEDGGAPKSDFADEVFRAYDIRGIVGEQIDKKFAYALGQAVASGAIDAREDTVLVARDARTHSPELAEWLIRGILSTGCNVINIGTVPTPLMYFALETLNEAKSGVMITASHNPAEYNGFKIVLNGVTRSGDDIKALRHRMIEGEPYKGAGVEHKHEVIDSYIDTIFSDVALAGELTVVVDAANAVPAIIAPRLFEELGCRVIPLYCDLDGSFPNHNPDPSIESNLKDLIAKVKEESADIGIALDGDGDRLVVVSPSGEIIWADRLLMAFSKDIISRNPGADVVFDVKCSRHLASCITNFGGRPVMWKTGHALMKQKMVESGAVVGGEYSGHIFIKDRWFGFDDGMYAAARLLEIMSLQGEDVDTLFSEFPISLTTPEIRISVSESRKFQIIEELIQKGDFGEGRLTLIDGVRVDYANGWGLVRASNTGPAITLRFEADDEKTMHKIKSIFVRELRAIDQSIQVDWNNN